ASSTLRRSRAFCFLRDCDHRDLHSFPTRRSSDLNKVADCSQARVPLVMINFPEMMRVYSEFKIGEIVENHDPQNIAQKIKSVLRSEEHTSELQSRENLVCRLLLDKKNSK